MGRSGSDKRRLSRDRAETLLRHEVFLLVQKGRAAVRRGHHREAEAAFGRVLQLEPAHAVALTGLGESFLRRKDFARACELYEQAIAAGGRSEHLLYAAATACRGALRRDKAFKYLQQLVEVNPSHLKGLTRLGEAWLERKAFEQAEETFRRALELDAHNLYALQGLGKALRGRRCYREAIGVYEQLLRIAPDEHRVLVRLGEAYAHVGDPASARRAYELALRMEPGNAYARDGLAALEEAAAGGRAGSQP